MANKLNELRDALDAAYPIPDSPHESVKQRARENGTAFIQGWQACAAHAANAQSAQVTQGELPPLPKTVHVVRNGLDEIAFYAYSPEEMRAYGQACAEAARQPAPVAVKTWQDEILETQAEATPGNIEPIGPVEKSMCREIADLRAALAARSPS